MKRLRPVSVIAVVMLLGFAVRLLLGMHTGLDADEATFALAGLRITHGELWLMEPNGQYLGALDAYVAAPFVSLFGSTLLAVRLTLAIVGALYVLTMYALGRALFKRHTSALLVAVIAATFPLFAVYWGVKLRGGYTELMLFEALALALCAKIGWSTRPRLRWWALLGLISGVALWSDLLFLVVLVVLALALLLRGPAIGWPVFQRGVTAAAGAGLVGLSPWLIFNVLNNLHSLHAIPKNYVGFRTGVSNLVSEHLPILVGGSSSCGHDVVPPAVSDAALGVLILALLCLRRRTLGNLITGHLSSFEPIDVVLVLIPATFVFLVLSRINYDPCAPRYVIPMAVPLAVGVAAALLVRWPWRGIALAVSAAWLAVSAVAAGGPLVDMQMTTPTGAVVPADLGPALAMINSAQPRVIWAQYWLSRPLSYYSGDTLAIGEYGGYVGFAARQIQVETAVDPSWAFVAGDREIGQFEKACKQRGITFQTTTGGGVVLFTHLSGTIEPADVFTGKEAQTN